MSLRQQTGLLIWGQKAEEGRIIFEGKPEDIIIESKNIIYRKVYEEYYL